MAVRDNGLTAGAYAPLADVDPPVVGHVLELLHDAGVAAYAEPFEGERGPYQDVRTPVRPTMRVYVDRARVTLARDVVGTRLPALRAAFLADAAARDDRSDMDEAQVEAAWAGIVADWSRPPEGPVGRWPASEDLTDDELRADSRPPAAGSGLSSRLIRRAERPDPGDDDIDEDGSDDPTDHYRPPPPPPLPRPDTVSRFAWAGLIGGPLALILMAVFQLQLDHWFTVLAMSACAGGFVTLVARMKDRPSQDDGWDDGAVV